MKKFNQERDEFLEQIKPILEKEFYNSKNKSIFLKKWKEIVKSSAFCKLKFSYKQYDYDGDDGEEFHQEFQFIDNFDYVDCTRENNPDCISGAMCFCFGQGFDRTDLAYIHTDSKNMVITHDDNIYLSKDIDKYISERLTWDGMPFLDFINILKPVVTNTILMKKDSASNWLQIERDNLHVRYICNITVDEEWDSGDTLFETLEKAEGFYFSQIEKYAKKTPLKLHACSDNIKSKVESLINKS